MGNIQKESDFKPLIIQASGRKPAQSHILLINFLKKCAIENKVVDRDSIIELYIYSKYGKAKFISIQESPVYSRWHDNADKMLTRNQFKQERLVTSRAMSWFKSSIGACVITGKLIVLPVIDIE